MMPNRRPSARRVSSATKITVPAPIGGLNTRDALDMMPQIGRASWRERG